MSRTSQHRPMHLELNDEGIANHWKQEYSKRYPSKKDKIKCKADKRRIRYAEIDETENKLYNAIAHFKGHIEARNRYY
jgi:hypothetical protein